MSNLLHPRSNPIQFPVGSLSFHFQETSFVDYMKEYYHSKHPEVPLPEEGEMCIQVPTNREAEGYLRSSPIRVHSLFRLFCASMSISIP